MLDDTGRLILRAKTTAILHWASAMLMEVGENFAALDLDRSQVDAALAVVQDQCDVLDPSGALCDCEDNF